MAYAPGAPGIELVGSSTIGGRSEKSPWVHLLTSLFRGSGLVRSNRASLAARARAPKLAYSVSRVLQSWRRMQRITMELKPLGEYRLIPNLTWN
jgi:hypothetical protein